MLGKLTGYRSGLEHSFAKAAQGLCFKEHLSRLGHAPTILDAGEGR